MGVAVFVQINVADAVMSFRRMVAECSELTVEAEGADFGSVLKAHAVGIKGRVGDSQRKLASFV